MAIEFRSASSVAQASRTNIIVPAPAGLAVGDVVVVGLYIGATSGAVNATPPDASWTQLLASPVSQSYSGYTVTNQLWVHVVTESEVSWTFTHTIAISMGAAAAYSGVDATTPIDTPISSASGTGQTSTAASLTTLTPNVRLVLVESDWDAGAKTPPTGMTERLDSTTLYIADQALTSAGETGTRSHTNGNTGGAGKIWAAFLVPLRTSGETPPVDTTAPSVPADITTSGITQNGFTVSWTASTDNVAVTGYEIRLNGGAAVSTATTSRAFTGLSASTLYSITVRARDTADNWSAWSSAVQATTSSGGTLDATTWINAFSGAIAGTGQARMFFTGDSISEGEGATSRGGRWIDLVHDGLRNSTGIDGGGVGLTPIRFNTYLSVSAPWRNPTTRSFTPSGRIYNIANSQWAQWSVTGTGFTILYVGAATGVVAVDGVAVGTFSNVGTTYSSFSHTFSSAGTHTVRVTASGGTTYVAGVMTYADGDTPTHGLTYIDWTATGAEASVFEPGQLYEIPPVISSDISPHLVVDELIGGNDYLLGTHSPAQVATYLENRIGVYRSWSTDPTIVVLIPPYWPGGEGPDPSNDPNGLGYDYIDYVNACTDKANELNVFIMDLRQSVGTMTSGDLASDNLHMSNAGQLKWADAITPYLTTLADVSLTSSTPLALGSGTVSNLRIGAATVVGAYLGSTKLFSDDEEPDLDPGGGGDGEYGEIGNRPVITIKPNSSTTGIRSATTSTMTGAQALVAVMARPVEADGFRVLRNVHVTNQLWLTGSDAVNIAFEDCVIEGGFDGSGNENYAAVRAWWSAGETPPASEGAWPEFRNCEIIGGANASVLGGFVRLLKCDIHEGYDCVQQHRALEVYGCYLHGPWYAEGDHSDVMQVLSGTGKSTVHYNNFSGFSGETSPVQGLMVNRCIQTGAGMFSSVDVDWIGNWFDGGGYLIDGTQPMPEYTVNYLFRNNKFGRNSKWGPIYQQSATLANSDFDSSNVWEDTSLPVVP